MSGNAARSKLYNAAEDAMADGLTLDEAVLVVREAHSSLLADRSFAAHEQGRDLYPHLAKGLDGP